MYDDAYIPDDNEWTDEMSTEEMYGGGDPFEGLTARDQDIFFRVIDMIGKGEPDEAEQRNAGIEYFMDHPAKIRAIVDNVKQKRELIKEQDVDGLKELFQRENIVIKTIDQAELYATTE